MSFKVQQQQQIKVAGCFPVKPKERWIKQEKKQPLEGGPLCQYPLPKYPGFSSSSQRARLGQERIIRCDIGDTYKLSFCIDLNWYNFFFYFGNLPQLNSKRVWALFQIEIKGENQKWQLIHRWLASNIRLEMFISAVKAEMNAT